MAEVNTIFKSNHEINKYGNVEFVDVSNNYNISKVYSVISLFSGCGGKDLGITGNFHFNNKFYDKNGFEIVWANDIDKNACKTYMKNFNHKIICGDIKEIDINQLPKADIVVGGFPCQDFSLSGKRKGFSSERGRLYLELKKVIETTKPLAFVAENVEGLLSLNGASTINKILEDLSNVGYDVNFHLFNAADYGVPQCRKRIFIVGIRSDINKKIYFPKPTHSEYGEKNRWVTAKEAIDDLWDKIGNEAIFNHSNGDYSKAKFYEGKKTQGNYKISPDKPANTIRAEHHGNIEAHYSSRNEYDPNNFEGWRRLSVRECARLQSFPDNFIFDCSASSAYKQVGNAVPPVLSWYIFRALYISLTES